MIDQSFEQLVQSIAAKTPTPGGGAAAGLSACIGTALLQMVVRFSLGKKANANRHRDLSAAEEQLDTLLHRLLPMAERDCAAFDRVSAAYGLPKDGEEETAIRNRAIEEAMVGAMIVPEELLAMVRDVFLAINPVVDCVGKNIASDLGSGAEALRAAAEGAHYNVRINANFLKDRALAEAASVRNLAVRGEVGRYYEAIREHVDNLI